MEETATKTETKRTPRGRVSFPSVFEPSSYQDGPLKYSVTLLFDKATDLSEMKREAYRVEKAKWPSLPDAAIKARALAPFRDGDKKAVEGYAGNVHVRFSSKSAPAVVDQAKQPIAADSDRFYAGCWAHLSYGAFAYDLDVAKGVSFGLRNIQKLDDGPRLDNRTTADQDFDEVEFTAAADDVDDFLS